MASVLKHVKINSFVLKWKRVVGVLSPLALKSCGGSHIKSIMTKGLVTNGGIDC